MTELEERNNNFKFLPITKIVSETSTIKTFCFSSGFKSLPGQFVMVWVPGVGQKPFSVGHDDNKGLRLTIFRRGDLTDKLFTMKIGDHLGISGPYGTSYSLQPNTHYIMVAGGYGVVPLKFLVKEALDLKNTKIDFCLGARHKKMLLFAKELKATKNFNLWIATNDGSDGHKGDVTDLLLSLLPVKKKGRRHNKTLVCVCGPELMEKKVWDICNSHKTQCEISIERYIKCGVGVCGQCAVDGVGICVCREGPVVKSSILSKITEFGRFSRDSSGLKHYFSER
jgi:dihydroorotate dehydrogenase electron transfer subunit